MWMAVINCIEKVITEERSSSTYLQGCKERKGEYLRLFWTSGLLVNHFTVLAEPKQEKQ